MATRRRAPNEIRAVDERLRFIAAVQQDPRGNFSRLCESCGVSRAKGYKWLERYRQEGPKWLEDRKPITRSCPHRTPDAVIDRVVRTRSRVH
jgi:hypothetical protein